MNESFKFPESLTLNELVDKLAGTLGPEDLQDLNQMDLDEAVGYCFTVLLEQGVEDPEALLISLGILE